jgi:hypothetical protein
LPRREGSAARRTPAAASAVLTTSRACTLTTSRASTLKPSPPLTRSQHSAPNLIPGLAVTKPRPDHPRTPRRRSLVALTSHPHTPNPNPQPTQPTLIHPRGASWRSTPGAPWTARWRRSPILSIISNPTLKRGRVRTPSASAPTSPGERRTGLATVRRPAPVAAASRGRVSTRCLCPAAHLDGPIAQGPPALEAYARKRQPLLAWRDVCAAAWPSVLLACCINPPPPRPHCLPHPRPPSRCIASIHSYAGPAGIADLALIMRKARTQGFEATYITDRK